MWKRLCMVCKKTLQTFYLFVTPESNLQSTCSILSTSSPWNWRIKRQVKHRTRDQKESCSRSTEVESRALYITHRFTCLWPVVHVKGESLSIEGNVIVKYRVPAIIFCKLKWLDWKRKVYLLVGIYYSTGYLTRVDFPCHVQFYIDVLFMEKVIQISFQEEYYILGRIQINIYCLMLYIVCIFVIWWWLF